MITRAWLLGIVVAGGMSALAMTVLASQGERVASLVVAIAFCLTAVFASLAFNRRFWTKSARDDAVQVFACARGNAVLMALTFGWGAFAMLCVYALTALWWWHSWQYGSGMLGIALVLLAYAWLVSRPERVPGGLSFLDLGAALGVMASIGAAVGLSFLFLSDKLLSVKPDWPANHIFVAGGIAISVLSMIAAVSHVRLRLRG